MTWHWRKQFFIFEVRFMQNEQFMVVLMKLQEGHRIYIINLTPKPHFVTILALNIKELLQAEGILDQNLLTNARVARISYHGYYDGGNSN